MAFARSLVATTDRAFQFVTRNGPLAEVVRVRVAPSVISAALQLRGVRRRLFRTVSQTAIAYHASALSQGVAGRVRAGDRLPWLGGPEPERDNFDPLRSLDWQAHVYGDVQAAFAEACERQQLRLHAFPWSPAAERAGFAHGASYLVRPDGHVALADPRQSAERLERYLASVLIRPMASRR
jgi:hypothetical protein